MSRCAARRRRRALSLRMERPKQLATSPLPSLIISQYGTNRNDSQHTAFISASDTFMASSSRSGSEAPPGVKVDELDGVGAITVERSPGAARLSELGVRSWPKWGGPRGRYALSYGARQTCYIVRGKVTATVEGSPDQRAVEFGAGDLVVFQTGTRCTWHITAAVDMHYAFDPP